MGNKHIKYFVLCIFAFLVSIVPVSVSAISLAEDAYNVENYENLADAFTYLQIIRRCLVGEVHRLKDNKNNLRISGAKKDLFTNTEEANKNSYHALGLDKDFLDTVFDKYDDAEQDHSVYSNVLDWQVKNKNDTTNGYVLCREVTRDIGKNPIGELIAYQQTALGTESPKKPVADIICGKDNDNQGFLKLTLHYYKSLSDNGPVHIDDPAALKLPEWVKTDSNGQFKDCTLARDKILNAGAFKENGIFGDTNYWVDISENTSFSFEDFFADTVGIKGGIDNDKYVPTSVIDSNIKDTSVKNTIIYGLKKALHYTNFTAGGYCGVSEIPRQEYLQGSDGTNESYYEIFYNGAMHYFSVGKINDDEKIIFPYVAKKGGFTCKASADLLKSSGENWKNSFINQCYNDAQGGLKQIDGLISKLETVTDGIHAERLASEAKGFIEKGLSGLPSDFFDNLPDITIMDDGEVQRHSVGSRFSDHGLMLYEFIRQDSTLNTIDSMLGFANIAKALGDRTIRYARKLQGEGRMGLNETEKVDLESLLLEFEDAQSQVADQYTETAKDIRNSIPEPISNKANGDKVENFYEISENGSVCIYSENVEKAANEINTKLPGIHIDYKKFDPYVDVPTSSNSGNVVGDACYQNAGSLGWAICPLMKSMAEGLGGLYDSVVEPFLVTNPGFFPNEGGTHDAWNVVVGIANIVIVILLLVVIFSQLTGVGIDNYGIKKILPKLLVVVILVNLSYIICQLAVDLSNILGNSLEDMLSNIQITISNSSFNDMVTKNGGGNAGLFKAIFNGASAGLVTVGAVALVSGAVSGGIFAGLILPLLLLLVSALVAVLFFFILLGARKAGVVILVVLAPVAIVCYMLPNTKRWFDKWLKTFEALLLVYPICGALIGGGQLTSKLILSMSTDYIMYFTGCILMVVPFFFVPSLLKGSLAAMGNIGTKISGIGRNLGTRSRNKLDSGIKNSDRYKNRVKYNQDKAALRRANRTINRLNKKSGGDASKLNRRQQARMGAATDVLKEQHRRELENKQKSGGNYVTAMKNKQVLEVEDAARDLNEYANAGYVGAKRTQSQLSHDEGVQDTLMYNEAGIVAAQRVKGQNARTEKRAEAKAGVFALNDALAFDRAKSRKEMQELKAYQDQFAGFEQADLEREARNASTWFSQPGGSQKMSALISTMTSRGMEEKVFEMLKKPGVNVSNDDAVMSSLASSNNYLLSAYGKKGKGKDFSTFETDGTLQKYIKDNDIKGADKDSLAEINNVGSNIVEHKTAMDGALNAQVPKVREQMNKLIKDKISSMSSLSDLSNFGLTAGGFGSMSDDTAQAMLNGVTQYIRSKNSNLTDRQVSAQAEAALRSAFANQIRDAKANDQISSKVSSGVGSIFGI